MPDVADASVDGTVVVIQARMTSTRLPGKVMLPLAGQPMLHHVIRRAEAIPGVSRVVLAIPEGPDQDPIRRFAATQQDLAVVTGSESDVLERTIAAARAVNAHTVVRVTSDCPMLDPAVSGAVLASYRVAGVEYARTRVTHGYPHGLDTEVVALAALRTAASEATDPYEREHVTPFIWRRPERFSTLLIDTLPDRRHWRLVVDTQADYELATCVYEALHSSSRLFGLSDLVRLFESRPDLLTINGTVVGTEYLGLTEDDRTDGAG